MLDDTHINDHAHPISPNHRANGQFADNNRANAVGRPSKVREKEILEAINNAMPPERVTELVEEMIDIARTQKSWRGIAAALTFCANYQLGKPVQRIARDNENVLEELLERLRTNRTAPPTE